MEGSQSLCHQVAGCGNRGNCSVCNGTYVDLGSPSDVLILERAKKKIFFSVLEDLPEDDR